MTDTTDVSAAREARDVAFERTFLKAYDTAEELAALLRATATGSDATISFELLQRAVIMLSFCAGYSAGAAPTEAARIFARRREPEATRS